MARKRNNDEGGGYSWMDTYGDMVTLLLTFFIMLFSMSTVDAERWEILVKAFSRNKDDNTSQIVMIPEGDGNDIAPAKGEKDKLSGDTDTAADAPTDLQQLAQQIQAFVDQNNMSESVEVKQEGDNVYLRFDNNLFFDGDSSNLRQSSREVLDFLGRMFTSLESQILMIRINGHTADIPSSPVNDWELSSSRASAVASYFEQSCKVTPEKLVATGYGKNHPIADNGTLEGQAKNRRVDIMVLGNHFDTDNTEELYNILKRTLDVDLFSEEPPEEPAEDAGDGAPAEEEAPSGEDVLQAEEEPSEPKPPVEPTAEEVTKAMEAMKALYSEAESG